MTFHGEQLDREERCASVLFLDPTKAVVVPLGSFG
jgi:hypothetical protein